MMIITVDTREQLPFSFSAYPEMEVVRGTLKTGDYSVEGYENTIAIERKNLEDLIGSLTSGRERFEREIERTRDMQYFSVVVEATMDHIRYHHYRSHAKPHAMLSSIFALQMRWRVPFVFAGSREGAEYYVYNTLRLWLREMEKKGDGRDDYGFG